MFAVRLAIFGVESQLIDVVLGVLVKKTSCSSDAQIQAYNKNFSSHRTTKEEAEPPHLAELVHFLHVLCCETCRMSKTTPGQGPISPRLLGVLKITNPYKRTVGPSRDSE